MTYRSDIDELRSAAHSRLSAAKRRIDELSEELEKAKDEWRQAYRESNRLDDLNGEDAMR